MLFVPLGLSLGRRGLGSIRVVPLAALLSLVVEVAQFWIPGRDPSASDFAFNSLGALLGAGMVGVLTRGSTAPAVRRRCLALLFGAGGFAALLLGAWLLENAYTPSAYWAQWTPRFEANPHYSGRVLAASLGDLPLPSGRLEGPVRQYLQRRMPLHIVLLVGDAPDQSAPIFGIADEQPRTIRRLSAAGGAAILEEYARASRFRLDQPAHRLPGAFRDLAPGQTVRLTLQRTGDDLCLEAGNQRDCARFQLRDAWRVVYAANSWRTVTLRLTGMLWLALLFVPTGTLLTRTLERVLATGAVITSLLLIALTSSLAASALDLFAAVAGLWAPAWISGRPTCPRP